MSVNSHKPHLLVLPEDQANSRMVSGFLLHPNLNLSAIQLLSEAGGWKKVTEDQFEEQIPNLRNYPERRIVLLFDYDVKGPVKTKWSDEKKLEYVEERKSDLQIPEDLKSRVFMLGVLSEPEELKKAFGLSLSLETIGETLAQECADQRNELWGHELLKHNQPELEKMISSVKPFLFRSS